MHRTNLTVTDARVLAHLGFVGSDTLAAMSQRLSIPRTTMHYALRKMERRGWRSAAKVSKGPISQFSP